MRYIPHTAGDIERLLEAIGVESVADLFRSIPPELRLDRELCLPDPLPENALINHLGGLNNKGPHGPCFAGGGAYRHLIPAAINHLLLRSEFYTAYTPYQPEISQGTLQAVFEFQTMIARLLGMEISNASMYDGATGVAEAVLMAGRQSRKTKVVVSAGLHPQYLETLRTYTKWTSLELVAAPLAASGTTDLEAARALIDDDVACLVLQSPNYLGAIEDAAAFKKLLDGRKKAKFVHAFTEPLAFGLIAPPGQTGADIACGEGQSLGIPMSYGGPGLGLFAVNKSDVRAMPGRVCGQTVDAEGKRAFCLTLSTREQHIRREKATSNICTNHGLMALAATVYMSLTGRAGLLEVANQNHAKAEYLKAQLAQIGDVPLSAPTFNEFVWVPKQPAGQVLAALGEAGVLGGIGLDGFAAGLENGILTCVTEANSREEIDRYVEIVRSL
ncbi:MAG: aminomethyl-transferring glycine dehydrogenase subunit GcvPA [Candidatus Lernaella stagnicola]|nr:aminomethyl-transferring glycine dehydrogenase subunit GcvPA [Candidatus Lernaella stagnicola]